MHPLSDVYSDSFTPSFSVIFNYTKFFLLLFLEKKPHLLCDLPDELNEKEVF